MFKRTVVVPIGVLLAACSTHPLVDDVTRQTTFQIVDSIRCEATLAIAKLRDKDNGIKPEQLPATYIGYEFQFQITENNNASISSLFKYPFKDGTLSVGLNAGAERARTSDRNFRILESFKTLVADEQIKRCERLARPDPSRSYPISGSIGLDEVITTYVNIDRLTNLLPVEEGRGRQGAGEGQTEDQGNRRGRSKYANTTIVDPPDEKETVQTFSDKLIFTTKLLGGLKPSVALSPVKGSFRLVDALADLTADRTDIHKVTVAIAVDRPEECKDLEIREDCEANERCRWITQRSGREARCANRPRSRNYSLRNAPFTYYNALAPGSVQAKTDARGKVLMELERQRLLDLIGPFGIGLSP
jgi:hypothetical protein